MIMISVTNLSAETGDSVVVSIDDLAWLAGDWRGDFEGNPFECHYTTPQGGVILSVSKEFQGENRCFAEFEKFEAKDSGLILTPYPGGRQSVPFILVDYNPDFKKAKFENKEHDFPTDITYEITEPDKMLITVAGSQDGKRLELKVNLVRAAD